MLLKNLPLNKLNKIALNIAKTEIILFKTCFFFLVYVFYNTNFTRHKSQVKKLK